MLWNTDQICDLQLQSMITPHEHILSHFWMNDFIEQSAERSNKLGFIPWYDEYLVGVVELFWALCISVSLPHRVNRLKTSGID